MDRIEINWPPSMRFNLGSISLLEIAMRTHSDLLQSFFSLSLGVTDYTLLQYFTTWLLIFYLFYKYANLIFKSNGLLQNMGEKRIYSGIFAIGVVYIGTNINANMEVNAVFIGLVFAIGLLLYSIHKSERSIYHKDSYAIKLFDKIMWQRNVKNKTSRRIESDKFRGAYYKVSIPLALLFVFLLVITIGGGMAKVFVSAFPFLEIIIILWALEAKVPNHTFIGNITSKYIPKNFNLEQNTINSIGNCLRSFAGIYLSIIILGGLFVSGLTIDIFTSLINSGRTYVALSDILNSLLSTIKQNNERFLISQYIIIFNFWNNLVSHVVLFGVSILSLVGWTQELKRLPHFLDYWEDRNLAEVEIPSRIRGFMLVPCIGIVWYGVYLHYSLSSPLSVSVVDYALFITSFVFLILCLRVIWKIFKSDKSQNIKNEHYWIVSGFLFLFIPYALHDGLDSFDNVFAVSLVTLYAFFLFVTFKISENNDYVKGYTDIVYMMISGCLILFLTQLFPGNMRNMGYFLGTASIVGSFSIGMTNMYQWFTSS